MELYIIRHGETDWNIEHRLQGSCDVPLNDRGRELARQTGEALKDIRFDHIYSSPLVRALETANIIRGDRECPIVTDDRLREISFGVNEGVPPDKISPGMGLFFVRPELYVPDEGAESPEELKARTGQFLEEVIYPLAVREPDSRVLISGHGAMNKGLMLHLKQLEIKDFWAGMLQKNCSITIFDIHGREARLLEEGLVLWKQE